MVSAVRLFKPSYPVTHRSNFKFSKPKTNFPSCNLSVFAPVDVFTDGSSICNLGKNLRTGKIMKTIELTSLSPEQLRQTLEELCRQRVHVARVGDAVLACGGNGKITSGSRISIGGRAIATVNSTTHTPSCSHGCPACPHNCKGKVISGHPSVLVDGLPVAVVGSACVHSACCGGNSEEVVEGYGSDRFPAKSIKSLASATKHKLKRN